MVSIAVVVSRAMVRVAIVGRRAMVSVAIVVSRASRQVVHVHHLGADGDVSVVEGVLAREALEPELAPPQCEGMEEAEGEEHRPGQGEG